MSKYGRTRVKAKRCEPKNDAPRTGADAARQVTKVAPTASFLAEDNKNLWQVLAQVRRGLPTREVKAFIENSRLQRKLVLKAARISERTLARKAEAFLSPGQSDRVARVKRIYDRAKELVGDEQRAQIWLQAPNRALGGSKPLELLDTDAGARCVEDILLRVSGGVFS